MLDKSGAIPNILSKLKKMDVGKGLALRTYKRDRSVCIDKYGGDEFEIKENGFEQNTFKTDMKGLRKLLKSLLKREFPRSNKIRVYERERTTDT